jgi:hypothetical protein
MQKYQHGEKFSRKFCVSNRERRKAEIEFSIVSSDYVLQVVGACFACNIIEFVLFPLLSIGLPLLD